MSLKLLAVPDWSPAPGKSAVESLCEEFGIAAGAIDDEYGVFSRYNDALSRKEHCFLTDCAQALSLPSRFPGRVDGPFPPVVALSG